MKWIGQHIVDFISRFRSDVYLEDLSTSTDTDVLVVNSDGKITKNTTTARTFQITVPGYATSITSTSNYSHRQSTTYLNWSGVDADPASNFPAADLVTHYFTMPYNGHITRARIQGISSTTDPFKFSIYKGIASSDAASLDLTLVGLLGNITPPTADETYQYDAVCSFPEIAAGSRLYVFYKKHSNSGSTNNYWNISLEGKYTN